MKMKLCLLLAVIIVVVAVTSAHWGHHRHQGRHHHPHRHGCSYRFRILKKTLQKILKKLTECQKPVIPACEDQADHSCLYGTETECNNNGYNLTTAFSCRTASKACCVRKPCEDEAEHSCMYPDEATCVANSYALVTDFACPASSSVCCKKVIPACEDYDDQSCLYDNETECNNNGYALTTEFACRTASKACCVRKPCETEAEHSCMYPDEATCNDNSYALVTDFACPSFDSVCCKKTYASCTLTETARKIGDNSKIKDYIAGGKTKDDCKQWCLSLDNCVAVDHKEGYCFLFEETPVLEDNPAGTHYDKTCTPVKPACLDQSGHVCIYDNEAQCNINGFALATDYQCRTPSKVCCVPKLCDDVEGHYCTQESDCIGSRDTLTTDFVCSTNFGNCCRRGTPVYS